jgi:transposase
VSVEKSVGRRHFHHVDGTKSPICMMTINRIGSYYQFEPTRSGAVAREMLKGYAGGVITDALKAYDALGEMPGIRKGLCWSHVRREFYEIIDDFPAAEEMVRLIDELFEVEAKAKTFEELRELRRTESKEIIKRMQDWLMKTRQEYLPGDAIIGAVNYCANHWRELKMFLKDISLPLSNNDAERALRHVVMGRKNFNGSKTINGADVAATLYTVIESAKKSGLQPKEYMKYVIEERWHGREPKSPNELSHEKFGKTKAVFPAKDNWEI